MYICRICLDPDIAKDMTELPHQLNVKGVGFEEVIMFCLNIQVSKDSEFDTKMCAKCFDSVLSFYEFKSVALKNNKYMMTLISKQEEGVDAKVKTEDLDNYENYEALDPDILMQDEVDDLQFNPLDQEIQGLFADYTQQPLFEEIIKMELETGPEGFAAVKTKSGKKRGRPNKNMASKTCGECGDYVTDLEGHLSTHDAHCSGTDTLTCVKCKKVFIDRKQLLKHGMLKHSENVKYHCSKCNKSVICLTHHNRVVHKQPSPLKACGHCALVTEIVPVYHCPQCPKTFKKQKGLDNHNRVAHAAGKVLSCRRCHKTFSRYSSWQDHLAKHSLTDSSQVAVDPGHREECNVCHKFYADVKAHKRLMHEKDKLPHACPSCARRFLSRSALRAHEAAHAPGRAHGCPRALCGKRFRTKYLLNNHVQSVHEEVKTFVCNYCNKGFFKKYHLERHLKTHESEASFTADGAPAPRPYRTQDSVHGKCGRCCQLFDDRAALLRHCRVQHADRRARAALWRCHVCDKYYNSIKAHVLTAHAAGSLPFPCGHCARRFLAPAPRDEHERAHTRERPCACAHCGKGFRTRALLKMHVESVHEKVKKFICQECSKGFYKKYHLEKHMLSHSSSRPHACPECGRGFKLAETLRRHSSLHSGERPFLCELCHGDFRSKALLASHMRSHSREQPFQCRFCPARYKRADYRLHHEKTKHLTLFADRDGKKKAGEK